jgi:hypothetical protein
MLGCWLAAMRHYHYACIIGYWLATSYWLRLFIMLFEYMHIVDAIIT